MNGIHRNYVKQDKGHQRPHFLLYLEHTSHAQILIIYLWLSQFPYDIGDWLPVVIGPLAITSFRPGRICVSITYLTLSVLTLTQCQSDSFSTSYNTATRVNILGQFLSSSSVRVIKVNIFAVQTFDSETDCGLWDWGPLGACLDLIVDIHVQLIDIRLV